MAKLADIIDEIKVQFEVLTAPTYPIEIANVTKFDTNLARLDSDDFPQISLIDTGNEERVIDIDKDGNVRFASELIIRGCVKVDTVGESNDETGKLEATIKQLIASEPTLTQVLQWKAPDNIERFVVDLNDPFFGTVSVRTRILYWIAGSAY